MEQNMDGKYTYHLTDGVDDDYTPEPEPELYFDLDDLV